MHTINASLYATDIALKVGYSRKFIDGLMLEDPTKPKVIVIYNSIPIGNSN